MPANLNRHTTSANPVTLSCPASHVFFVLRFFVRALPLPCIILNENRRTKNGGGLGTRLSHAGARSGSPQLLEYNIIIFHTGIIDDPAASLFSCGPGERLATSIFYDSYFKLFPSVNQSFQTYTCKCKPLRLVG